MNKVLLSRPYVVDPEAPATNTRFGRVFYEAEVGFGSIEEIDTGDGYLATAVTFADIKCEPFINYNVEEVGSDLVPGGRELAVRAVALAIANRSQTAVAS